MLAGFIVTMIAALVPVFFVVAFAWCLWSIGKLVFEVCAEAIERRRHVNAGGK